jgi:hypothetical protein
MFEVGKGGLKPTPLPNLYSLGGVHSSKPPNNYKLVSLRVPMIIGCSLRSLVEGVCPFFLFILVLIFEVRISRSIY